MSYQLKIQDLNINQIQIKTHYYQREEAKRSTIIFLHDSLGCIKLWRNFPLDLGEQTQSDVFIYDRQGYGESSPFSSLNRQQNYMELEADFLHLLITEMKFESVILFGHSDGGTIALLAAAKYPQKIKAVITEGAHVFVEDITLQGIRAAVEQYQNTNLKEKLEKYHGDKTEDVFKAWTETWLSPMYRNWNIEHWLKDITCPCLIIQGVNDEYGSEAQVDAIVHQVSGLAIKQMIPEAGHTPHKEAAEPTIREAVFFISRYI